MSFPYRKPSYHRIARLAEFMHRTGEFDNTVMLTKDGFSLVDKISSNKFTLDKTDRCKKS